MVILNCKYNIFLYKVDFVIFYEKTEIMDRVRKQNWETTFPELSILNIPEFRKTNFTQGPYSNPGTNEILVAG